MCFGLGGLPGLGLLVVVWFDCLLRLVGVSFAVCLLIVGFVVFSLGGWVAVAWACLRLCGVVWVFGLVGCFGVCGLVIIGCFIRCMLCWFGSVVCG